MIEGIDLDFNSKPEFCETCIKVKAAWKPFPKKSLSNTKTYGEKVITDIWGPTLVYSLRRHNYCSASKTPTPTMNTYIS